MLEMCGSHLTELGLANVKPFIRNHPTSQRNTYPIFTHLKRSRSLTKLSLSAMKIRGPAAPRARLRAQAVWARTRMPSMNMSAIACTTGPYATNFGMHLRRHVHSAKHSHAKCEILFRTRVRRT